MQAAHAFGAMGAKRGKRVEDIRDPKRPRFAPAMEEGLDVSSLHPQPHAAFVMLG